MTDLESLPAEYLEEFNLLYNEIHKKKPQDIVKFCANHFSKRLQARKEPYEDTDPLSKIPELINKPKSSFKPSFSDNTESRINCPSPKKISRRTSVSAESLNPNSFTGTTTVLNHLSSEQLDALYKIVPQNFLFANLDEEALRNVLQSLNKKKVEKNEIIINQGDEGYFFYIVEKGSVNFFVDNVKVGSAGSGSCFGELALMYNAPRAATVIASEPTTLWTLDRPTFREILLHGTHQRRLMYEGFLSDVPILSSLTFYERCKLADALTSHIYKAGETVIHEGEPGDSFYLIEYGTAEVHKKGVGIVQKLGKGDYFGEIALLNDLPRQAAVIATNKLKVASLGKDGFQRLLGPILDHLKKQDPTQNQ